MSRATTCLTLVDLFSGAGGMSFGFHRHPNVLVIAAGDAELGKPSRGGGALQCNATDARNIGVQPVAIDLSTVAADALPERLWLDASTRVNVLSACPPCTGFSRANPSNHRSVDLRNSLVRRCGELAAVLDVDILVMENARELIRDGWRVRDEATTVRRVFAAIDPRSSGVDAHPGFASSEVLRRLRATPRDGGAWMDLLSRPDCDQLLTPAMQRIARERRFGSYPDVYGRMAWDKPAPTIKRECAHVGNGRYAYPEEDRLCSVREMAMLQGFPNDLVFADAALSNLDRRIGDAVPPLISHQIAHLCAWILKGRCPTVMATFLQGTHLPSRRRALDCDGVGCRRPCAGRSAGSGWGSRSPSDRGESIPEARPA